MVREHALCILKFLKFVKICYVAEIMFYFGRFLCTFEKKNGCFSTVEWNAPEVLIRFLIVGGVEFCFLGIFCLVVLQISSSVRLRSMTIVKFTYFPFFTSIVLILPVCSFWYMDI